MEKQKEKRTIEIIINNKEIRKKDKEIIEQKTLEEMLEDLVKFLEDMKNDLNQINDEIKILKLSYEEFQKNHRNSYGIIIFRNMSETEYEELKRKHLNELLNTNQNLTIEEIEKNLYQAQKELEIINKGPKITKINHIIGLITNKDPQILSDKNNVTIQSIIKYTREGFDSILVENLIEKFNRFIELIKEKEASKVENIFIAPKKIKTKKPKIVYNFDESEDIPKVYSDTSKNLLQTINSLPLNEDTQINTYEILSTYKVETLIELSELIHEEIEIYTDMVLKSEISEEEISQDLLLRHEQIKWVNLIITDKQQPSSKKLQKDK